MELLDGIVRAKDRTDRNSSEKQIGVNRHDNSLQLGMTKAYIYT